MYFLRMAVDTGDLAKEEPRDVEHVAADICQHELFEFPQEGLIDKHRKAADHIDMCTKWTPDVAALQHPLHFTKRVLPAKIFMDEKWRASLPAYLYHLLCLRQGLSHWFLANDRQTTCRGQLDEAAMGGDIADDVDEIQLFTVKQRLDIVIHGGDMKFGG